MNINTNSFAMVPGIKGPTNAMTCLSQLSKKLANFADFTVSQVFFAKYYQSRSARALRRALARILQATPYFARRQMLPRGVSRNFFVAKFCRYTVYHRATEGILMSMSIGMVVALLRDEKWGGHGPLGPPVSAAYGRR